MRVDFKKNHLESILIVNWSTFSLIYKDVKEGMKTIQKMTFLEAADIAGAIHYSLAQPARANVNDVFIMPTEQQR